MKTRAVLVSIALLLAATLYIGQHSARRGDELAARVGQVEEQLQFLKRDAGSTEIEEVKAENVRLAGENKALRASLIEAKQNAEGVADQGRIEGPFDPRRGQGHDPLAFFRRNPELMKRYFPHLSKEEKTKAEGDEEIPSPPADKE